MPIEFDHQTHHTPEGVIWEVTAKFGSDFPELRPDFGLDLGECLHNYRSALDHTAWWLVRTAKTKLTAEVSRRVQYPMARSKSNFWNGGAAYRLPGVSKDLLAVIEPYQPYHRTLAGNAMRYLRDLTNLDKHRSIIVTQTYTGKGNFQFAWEGGMKVADREWARAGGKLKRGTKIATIFLLSPPPMQPQVDVQGTVDYSPAFPPSILRPYAGRVPVAARLALLLIGATCSEIVDEIEARL